MSGPGDPYAVRPMRRVVSMVCCGVLLLGACGVDSGVAATDAQHSDATFDPNDDPFGWTKSRDNDRVEIGTFTAPVDYSDPSKGKFQLDIARHLAMKPEERIGSLLVNPGGPGFGGTDFAVFAETNFGQSLLDHFDIVAWDPRGTGESTPPIDCIDDYDHFFATPDVTPDDEAERQQVVDLAEEFTDDCVDKDAGFYQYVGSNNSARDMDAIRAALGEATISYLGFSYGSELGATWATLFPKTVRAAVLDGAVDPTANEFESDLQQAEGFESSLNTFLAACDADPKCPFNNNGNAEDAFDALMKIRRRVAGSQRGRQTADQPWHGQHRCRRRAVHRGEMAAAGAGAERRRHTVKAPGCWRSTTSTTCASRSGRTATSWRRSR